MLDRNESMLYSDKYMELNVWANPANITYEDHAIRVREYRKANDKPSVIIAPPNAGHTSIICDYDKNQSQAMCAVENYEGGVYLIDWKDCTKDRGNEDYEDLIVQLDTAIDVAMTGTVHLISNCQASPLAVCYTTLYPEKVESLTIAGAPINPHAAPSVLDFAIKCVPLSFYKTLIASFRGVMDGDFMVNLWKSSQLKMHYVDKYSEEKDNYRSKRFYSWFDESQSIAGAWYLFVIEHLFKNNELINNKMELFGQKIILDKISCPLNIVYGAKDEISPKEHSVCLAEKVSTPKEKIQIYQSLGGHLGVFQGTKTIATIWTEIFKNLNSQS